jgi:hypothetical protein
MKIYSPQISTPALAITLATALSNTQPLLFTSHFGDKGTYKSKDNKTQDVELKWVIKDAEITLTRDWGNATAFITLSCTLPSMNGLLPPLPDVSLYRKGIYKYLSEEDEIRVYAGYVESTITPITADLLDEIPFDFEDVQSTDTNTITYKTDPSKPLAPIFWGFIDKLEFSGDANGGLQLIISCRDRVRVFADTRIISLQTFQGKGNSDAATSGKAIDEGDFSSIAGGDRANIILALANGAAGNPLGAQGTTTCWKPIESGLIVRGYTYSEQNKDDITRKEPREDPSSWVRTATCRIMNDLAKPRMNVWAERPPIVKGEPTSTLQVLNKTPLEIIDYMAKVEERPMDFWASHINGDYTLGPRVKDTSGFDDSSRSYRTYFFNSYPPEVNRPSANQMIIKIKTSRSTLFSFNKFIIIDSTLKKDNTSLIGAIQQGFTAIPYHLKDRNPSPPCKTQVIYDGGLASYANPQAGALQLGLAHARVWSRDTQGIQIEVVGDPTLYPSEAIRVYNTFLHDYQAYVMVDNAKDEKAYVKSKADLEKVAVSANATTTDNDKTQGNNAEINNTMDSYLSNSPARVPTNIQNLVIPYYTIRSVQHKITCGGDRGWTSVVQSVTDV